ncbi:unnamed protein product [Toxocara canis]|uniref:Amidase domain-containing protein n=1 Tax=Toxocara canis TaxID=6265 RepID=A0A183U0X3_TOXCA|nr:unnamed protein product [Toxocara canis]
MEFAKEGWGAGTYAKIGTDGAGGTAAAAVAARAVEILTIGTARGVEVTCRPINAVGVTFFDGINTAAGGTAFGGPNPGVAPPLCPKIMFKFMLDLFNGS